MQARRLSGGIIFFISDLVTRLGRPIKLTPRPHYSHERALLPLIREVGAGMEKRKSIASDGIRTTEHLAHNELLYRLR